MNLAYPIGLFALAALVIPLLIHLWSVKQGKIIKIGSISLLGENSTASSKSLKLTDLLLFILRCLILMLIALMLAQAYYQKTNVLVKNTGWILMDRNELQEVYSVNRKTIDSLLAKGFELRDFNLGFKQFTLKDSTAQDRNSVGLSYPALIKQLNKEIPSGYSAYIFADQRLASFDGDLPSPNFKLFWRNVIKRDTVKTWSTTFLGKVYEAKSTPHLTSYIAANSQNLPVVEVFIHNPKGNDSKYIKAALYAISDFTKRKIEMASSRDNADVLFWLSDEPLPRFRSTMFAYKRGKIEDIHSTIQLSEEPNQAIELKKRIAIDDQKGDAIWKDSYGEPILVRAPQTKHFYFYSRFNPQWNDLVWSEHFVKALIPIVLDNQQLPDFGFQEHDADQRVINTIPFASSKSKTLSGTSVTAHISLETFFWILAGILLMIERFLSFRQKSTFAYAKN